MVRTYSIEHPMDWEPAGTKTYLDGTTRSVTYYGGSLKVVVWTFPEGE